MCFVFGSNESGDHGAGAAYIAHRDYGAQFRMSYGHYGDSFAIPTKDKQIRHTLALRQINDYVRGFIAYARAQHQLQFQVTRIGCGLAGLSDEDIAPMFLDAPNNCFFDEAWKPILGEVCNYWGTF